MSAPTQAESPAIRAGILEATRRGNVVCFFDVTIAGHPIGRLRIELFVSAAPRTCENFRQLCTGEHRIGGRSIGYKGCVFHRVINDFMVQGGDFTRGDGTGRQSIYGETFADENFSLKHDSPGLLAMANSGPDTNGSQFYLTLAPCDWLDGKHCVFGKLLDEASLLTVRPSVRSSGNCVVVMCGRGRPTHPPLRRPLPTPPSSAHAAAAKSRAGRHRCG